MAQQGNDLVLSVRGLKTYFPVRRGLLGRRREVRAVDGVDLSIRRGQTVALVGESGSGKTTVGRTILRLIPATAGEVAFDGQDVFSLRGRALRTFRRRAQVIFQDPVGSLNPRMTVGRIVGEPLAVHKIVPRGQRRRRVAELLERVGLAAGYANRYPHEFSGGQRQRIGIARALACEPELIVCDEPVSALDVSIQAQILNLLSDLQEDLGLAYLLIAHNLAVVEHFSDEIAVMYLGRIVECAGRGSLYARPTHPYTRLLLSSVPLGQPGRPRQPISAPGEMPSPISPPSGCPFHPRCALTRRLAEDSSRPDIGTTTITTDAGPIRVVERCTRLAPSLTALADDPGHSHACLLQ